MGNPTLSGGVAGRGSRDGPGGTWSSRPVVALAACLLAAPACATTPENVTVLEVPLEEPEIEVPLEEPEIEEVRDEAGDREAQVRLGPSMRPRMVNARLWSLGPDSLRYAPTDVFGEPVTVHLRDVSRLAFPRGRGEIAFRGAVQGAFEGAARGLFEEGLCSGSFLPSCSADYGGALRGGAFSGAAVGLLGGLLGGDRDPPAYTFIPRRR